MLELSSGVHLVGAGRAAAERRGEAREGGFGGTEGVPDSANELQ